MTKKLPILFTIILALSFVLAGGYFVHISVLISLLLGVLLLWCLGENKRIQVPWDINMGSLVLMVGMYLLTSLWAVDKGMTIMGFYKFLPVLFFFVLLQQMENDSKESVIQFLPTIGSLMTIFSVLLMQFGLLEGYITVAGRLAGFFQYPNTYAAFMLVCFVISVYKIDWKAVDWRVILNALVALIGIYLSGSRTVFIITMVVILYMVFSNRQIRKFVLPCVGVGTVAAVIWSVVGNGVDVITRLSGNLLQSSTFLGRLLYYADAAPVILQNPFGLGYYGYYSVQQEIQTGVYSVLNVHNELLQFMLDIGVIPAVLLYGCWIRQMVKKGRSIRDRLVFGVLLAHSLFDYDFQFIAMCFVLLLFVQVDKKKELRMKKKHSIAIVGMVTMVVLCMGIGLGASEFFYTQGENETAVKLYTGNTAAKLSLLTQVETAEEMEQLADDILESNAHSALAYSAKARVAFSKGKMELFMKYKQQALELAPYQYGEYVDYVESLLWAYAQYAKAGDIESAGMCIKRAEAVYDMLEDVKEKTHPLAWKIKDVPQLTLPESYTQALEAAKETIK